MSVALRTITRLQDADDINVSLGAGVDEYALSWDNDTARFVLRAPFAGLLATGATTGATSQAQTFTNGIVGPSWKPSADSTTALQLQKAAGTAVLNVDTTNGRVGIGTTAPERTFAVETAFASPGCQLSLFAPSMNAGTNVSIGIGKSLSSQNSAFLLWYSNGASSYAALETYGGASPFYVVASQAWLPGTVGIGTTSPATRLDIDAGAMTMAEMTAPTGAANKATMYTKDNGSGKTQLCVKLGDDVEIVLATQA